MSSPSASRRRSDIALGALVAGLVFVLLWVSWFGGSLVMELRETIQRVIPAGDKLGHFVLYGAIAFFAALLVRRWGWVLLSSLAIFGLGVFDELRQIGEVDRSVSATDLLANGLGIVAGVGAALVLLWLRARGISARDLTRRLKGTN